MKKKSANLFATIGAICLILCVVSTVYLCSQRKNVYLLEDYKIPLSLILDCVISISLSILLFMRKKNIALVVVGVANTLICSYCIARSICLYNILSCVASVVVLIIFILNGIPSLNNKAKVTKFIWFFPGMIYFLNFFIHWIPLLDDPFYKNYMFIKHAYYFNIDATGHLIFVIAYIFIGLWLRSEFVVKKPKLAKFPMSQNVLSGADNLKQCKELLDSGAITQEEFDAKKKKILGL